MTAKPKSSLSPTISLKYQTENEYLQVCIQDNENEDKKVATCIEEKAACSIKKDTDQCKSMETESPSLDSRSVPESTEIWKGYVSEVKSKFSKRIESNMENFTLRKNAFLAAAKSKDLRKLFIQDTKDSMNSAEPMEHVKPSLKSEVNITEESKILETIGKKQEAILQEADNIKSDAQLNSEVKSFQPEVEMAETAETFLELSTKQFPQQHHGSTSWPNWQEVAFCASVLCIGAAILLNSLFTNCFSFISGMVTMLIIFFAFKVKQFFSSGVTSERKKFPVSLTNVQLSQTHWQTGVHLSKLDVPLLEGWMLEMKGEYTEQSYHESILSVVYVHLSGNWLRIFYSKNTIPKKARWNESNLADTVEWNSYKMLNLSGCVVKLLPKNLSINRLWKKKYPIVIYLNEKAASCYYAKKKAKSRDKTVDSFSIPLKSRQSHSVSLPNILSSASDSEKFLFDNEESDSVVVSEDMIVEDPVYLFARCDRDKEEW